MSKKRNIDQNIVHNEMMKKKSGSSSSEEQVLCFGLLADLHYMDADNATNYAKTKIRRFRQSLSILQQAADVFEDNNTNFNILLGDIIDGTAHSISDGLHLRGLDTVRALTDGTRAQWYFTMGNHEFYNFTRSELRHSTGYMPSPAPTARSSLSSASRNATVGLNTADPTDSLYYSFYPQRTVTHFRVIVLDGYDTSSIGASTPEQAAYSEALLREKNPAYAAGDSNWFASLPKENLRYVPFNGGVGNTQLAWLEAQLQEVVRLGERCFIVCHMPLDPRSSSAQNPLWNYEDVLSAVHTHSRIDNSQRQTRSGSKNKNGVAAADAGTKPCSFSSAVIAVISGHAHNGGYYNDPISGIHHITPPAPVECDEDEVSYGMFRVMAAAGTGWNTTVDRSSYVEVEWTGKTPVKSVHPWPKRMYF